MFKEKFQFSRERLEFLYSVGLLILIPVLVAANTLILVTAVRGDFDTELRRKAALANEVISQSVKPDLNNPMKLQSLVDGFADANKELQQITVDSNSA